MSTLLFGVGAGLLCAMFFDLFKLAKNSASNEYKITLAEATEYVANLLFIIALLLVSIGAKLIMGW